MIIMNTYITYNNYDTFLSPVLVLRQNDNVSQ